MIRIELPEFADPFYAKFRVIRLPRGDMLVQCRQRTCYRRHLRYPWPGKVFADVTDAVLWAKLHRVNDLVRAQGRHKQAAAQAVIAARMEGLR